MGRFAAVFGIAGVLALLGQALYRLTPLALAPLDSGMTRAQWALYAASIAFNAYAEGYRAFQLMWSPRVVARALHLARHPRPLHVALAPLFCMGLFHATRKRLVVAWGTVAAVVTLILLVHQLSQPWRGIVDAGVVVGLGWGLIALLVFAARAAAGTPPAISPDVPAAATASARP